MGLREESLIFRVDASAQIGTGHLMRCLALGQVWQDEGGKTIFVTACQSESLLGRLREEGVELKLLSRPYTETSDWEQTRDILAKYPGAWVVLDGYHFDEVYQQRVRESGHRLLVIDDIAHLKHYYADILLNQNLYAEQLHYPVDPDTRLLLGTRYALLRRDFLAWKGWRREIPEVGRKVLVTLGGADPENHTLKVIRAIQETGIPSLEATVVIGASNRNVGVPETAVRQSLTPVRLIQNANNMPELMARADVAISAGGSTCWELAFMGLPSIILVLADNQKLIARAMDNSGAATNLGWSAGVDSAAISQALSHLAQMAETRREMSRRGQQLVDGRGGQRVSESLKEKRGIHQELAKK